MAKRTNTWEDVVYKACLQSFNAGQKIFDKKTLINTQGQFMLD